MKKRNHRIVGRMAACLIAASAAAAYAAEDGLGTNHIERLSVATLQFGQEARTNWPSQVFSLGGAEQEVASRTGELIWSPEYCGNGTLQKARMQVNAGTADVLVVRSAWNAAWGSCTTLNTLRVTAEGVEDATWSSAWVSNDYRLGILITNSADAQLLWWSVTHTRE